MLLLAALVLAWSQQSVKGNERDVPTPLRLADSGAPSVPEYQPRMLRAVSYGPSPDEIADICTPDTAYLNAPAIVFIHGGAWAKGDQTSMDAECQTAARHGLVGMTIQYRQLPTNVWPSQLEDAQLAVRWLRAHAQDYKADPARICSWGKSSGAQLAVFLGVMQMTQAGDRANLYAGKSSAVSCVVDNFGPVDLTNAGKLQWSATHLAGDSPGALRDASPLFLVDAHTAPMLIVQGDADTLVDRNAQSQMLQQALQQRGIPAQLLIYHGDHGFAGLSDDEKSHYVDLGIRFVLSRVGNIRLQ